MTTHVFATAEKLAEVERLLREDPRNEILKAIAQDLRARSAGVPSAALIVLEQRVVAAVRAKTPVGYPHNHLVDVAEHVLGRWPILKQALEMFGAAAETGELDVPKFLETRTGGSAA